MQEFECVAVRRAESVAKANVLEGAAHGLRSEATHLSGGPVERKSLECRERFLPAVIKERLGNSRRRGGSDFCEPFDGGGAHTGVVIAESIDQWRDGVSGGDGCDCAQC